MIKSKQSTVSHKVTIIIFTQAKQVRTVHTAYVNYTSVDLLVHLHIAGYLGLQWNFKQAWIKFKSLAHLKIIAL